MSFMVLERKSKMCKYCVKSILRNRKIVGYFKINHNREKNKILFKYQFILKYILKTIPVILLVNEDSFSKIPIT